jgi:hypothetical protein
MNIEVATWRGAFHREVDKEDPATGLFYLFEPSLSAKTF